MRIQKLSQNIEYFPANEQKRVKLLKRRQRDLSSSGTNDHR